MSTQLDYHFVFLIRSWNSFEFFDKCVDSIFALESKNYSIIFVDDCSGYTPKQKKHISSKLAKHRFFFNSYQKYSVRNAYEQLHTYAAQIAPRQWSQTIVVSLDGDDWLYRKDALKIINQTYVQNHCLLTYGNCIYYQPGTAEHLQNAREVDPTANRRYPREVELHCAYRTTLGFPPLHLKTWRLDLFLRIPKAAFLRPDGRWLQFCEDQAILYSLLEMAQGRYAVIKTVLSVYNRSHHRNDDKINYQQMIHDEVHILMKRPIRV